MWFEDKWQRELQAKVCIKGVKNENQKQRIVLPTTTARTRRQVTARIRTSQK
jgi:hypothetical protein